MSERRWPEVDVLEQLISNRRLERIDSVLDNRIVTVTAVFEDLYDPRNVAAGLRTCDAFGLADAHVITEQHAYRLDGDVSASSEQWLSIHRYGSTEDCIETLRSEGFAIWVSDLAATKTLDELDVEGKIALVVGAEKEGITEKMRQAADVRYILPMHGMVQSFNVSVALAISLQTIMSPRRAQLGGHGDMSIERQWKLRRQWLEHGIRHAKKVRAAYDDPHV